MPLPPPNRETLVRRLSEVPIAKHVLEGLSADLLPICPRVLSGKEVNDPVWKNVHLTPLEVCLLDTPLMQRLRRVRQLGFAHLVYPGASHSRLEHSIGVMHAARRMFDVLSRTVGAALNEGERTRGRDIVGIAGLLHDCGHVVFSHVGENILGQMFEEEFRQILKIFDGEIAQQLIFERTNRERPQPRPAELLSALLVVSRPMVDLFVRQGDIPAPAEELTVTIASLVLGYAGPLLIGKQYLYFMKDIISGDIDADKIDYVARDGYFAGVPLAIDVDRLLSQLIAIDLNRDKLPDSVTSRLPAREVDAIYATGLKPTGASAMEMLVLTRVYLFDRIYLHHKVKAAERFAESTVRSYLSQLVQRAVLDDQPEAENDLEQLRDQIIAYHMPSRM